MSLKKDLAWSVGKSQVGGNNRGKGSKMKYTWHSNKINMIENEECLEIDFRQKSSFRVSKFCWQG